MLARYFGNIVGQVESGKLAWSSATVDVYGAGSADASMYLDARLDLAGASLWRGHRLDPTGFYWMGDRTYEPVSGRFLSADPLGPAAGLSLYTYCNGDPVNLVDPTGRFAAGGQYPTGLASQWEAQERILLHGSEVFTPSEPSMRVVDPEMGGSGITIDSVNSFLLDSLPRTNLPRPLRTDIGRGPHHGQTDCFVGSRHSDSGRCYDPCPGVQPDRQGCGSGRERGIGACE